MANTFKFGNGEWAVGKETVLAYNDENNNFKPLPFTFERGSIATVVNKDGLIETVGVDEPRIDFLNNSKGHLLLEPQRANLFPYSEDFTQWDISTATITSNSLISPDGGQNSYTLTTSASGGTVQDTISVANGDVTFSVFVKKGTTNGVRLRIDAATDSNGYFDLVSNTIYSSDNDAKIENYGNDWYRVSISANVTSFVKASIYTTDGTTSYDNGTLNIWGAQLEQGSYPTSYIVSNSGSATTRAAETANNSGNADLFNDSEGVLYAQIAALADENSNRAISISDGTLDNRVVLRINSDVLYSYVQSNGVYSMFKSITISEILNYNKFAVKFKEDDFEVWVNGSRLATDNAGNPPIGLNILEFQEADGSSDFYGKTKELAVFKEALTDAELESLTSWISFTEMATDLEYTVE